MKLEGRTAVITGVSSGIGRAIAVAMAAEGARVRGLDVNVEGARNTVKLIRETGGDADFRECDLADREMIVAAFEHFDGLEGEISVLVNCAAMFAPWAVDSRFPRPAPEDIDADLWRRMVDVNLTGAFFCAQEAGRRMIAAKRPGAIVNISSVGGASALARSNVSYGAGKAGLQAVTKELAAEWGIHGIRVNAVLPGHVRTENLQRILDKDPALTAAMLDKAHAAIPLRRFGEPEDIAAAVVFLASDSASFITGVLLPVDGGNLALNAGGGN